MVKRTIGSGSQVSKARLNIMFEDIYEALDSLQEGKPNPDKEKGYIPVSYINPGNFDINLVAQP